MQITVSRRTGVRLILLLSAGLAAGFLNGILGAGGVLPVTLLSAILYAADGRMDFPSVTPLVLPAVLGGTAGALLLGRINTKLLKKLFALLVIWSGISMLTR